MNTQCNPLRTQGDRNVFCPFYNECLDYAVKQSWEDWSCHECSHQFNEEGKPELQLTVAYSIPYYELISRF